jgi:hypothetical protein
MPPTRLNTELTNKAQKLANQFFIKGLHPRDNISEIEERIIETSVVAPDVTTAFRDHVIALLTIRITETTDEEITIRPREHLQNIMNDAKARNRAAQKRMSEVTENSDSQKAICRRAEDGPMDASSKSTVG